VRVEVMCAARMGGFPAPCVVCGAASRVVVRSSWRTAHAPLASLRHHFCLDHRRNALLLQMELVAEAAARRYASPTGPAALPFPFVLPDAFLPRLGYPWDDRLVALHWDAAGDVLCLTGRHWVRVPRFDAGLWFALVHRPAVALWLREHMTSLGSRHGDASHALLVDGRGMKAVVARVAQAQLTVAARAVPEEPAPPAAGTPKGGN
jgi:hypothetical protein